MENPKDSFSNKAQKTQHRLLTKRLTPKIAPSRQAEEVALCSKTLELLADVQFMGRTWLVGPRNQTCLLIVPRLNLDPGEQQTDEEETSWCV